MAAHGTGSRSFLYYLKLIGTPAAAWKHQFFGLIKLREQYNIAGLIIDDDTTLKLYSKYFIQNKPVFWLVRDPVDLIMSCTNALITGIFFNILKDETASGEPVNRENLCMTILNNISGKYCSYSSQLRIVQKYSSVMLIDTQDIMPERVAETMTSVSKKLGVPIDNSIYADLNLANTYDNRFWGSFSPLSLGQEEDFNIYPSELSSYFCLCNQTELKTIIHDSKEYKITSYREITLTLEDETLHDIIDFRLNLFKTYKNFYENNAITQEYVLDFFKRNKLIKIQFLQKQQKELALVNELFPGHIKQWKNFQKLFE